MELNLESADADTLIADVNGLEEMLRHASAFRTEGKQSGYSEVFLQFKTGDATHSVWYPVLCGQIDKTALMKACGSDRLIDKVPVIIMCEAYWESLYTYDLENLLDNPGFEEWNDGICDSQPDCWTNMVSITGGSGTNNQETEVVEEGCKALRIEVEGINNNDYKGVEQNSTARVRAYSEYTLLAWVQNEDISAVADIRVDAYAPAVRTMCTAISSGLPNAEYTLYSCQFTPDLTDIAAGIIIRAYIDATATPCTAQARIDKMLVMETSNVPVGWMSSSYLTNHYDRDPNEVNFLSVCDIPGEVDSELRLDLVSDGALTTLHLAKRTREKPCNFIWQLLPCDAYTEAESAGPPCNPNLVHALAKDSDKLIAGTSPCGCYVDVDFALVQNMAVRCWWEIKPAIIEQLESYSGKFAVAVLADKSMDTDSVHMQVYAYADHSFFLQGQIINQVVLPADWGIISGFSVFSFPPGAHDRQQWDQGNEWRIGIRASITGAAPWDHLMIAGVLLIPLDEAYCVAGAGFELSIGDEISISDLDGIEGMLAIADTGVDRRFYSNIGYVGKIPGLTPKVENYLYFLWRDDIGTIIANTMKVTARYRPRGIFLRGTNP